ncbi:MAG: hypothetical protein K2G26_00260, partial [Clostridia bacterium]|nr:hypothetical protein [Clostridia bacterium]
MLNLGGQEWAVSFLTTDMNGNVIATLWMTQPLKNASGSIVTTPAGWGNNGYNTNYTATIGESYIADAYATSKMRMETFNAGPADGSATKYAYGSSNANVTSLSSNVTADARKSNVLAPFTLNNTALSSTAYAGKSLIEYITAPKDVYYTYYLDWAYTNRDCLSAYATYNIYLLNEALSKDVNGNYTLSTTVGKTDTNFYSDGKGAISGAWWNSGIYNYSNSTVNHYNDWGDDYVWAPSASETGKYTSSSDYALGLWGTGGEVTGQIKFKNENTTSLSATVTTSSEYVWTRAGGHDTPYRFRYISSGGASGNNFPAASFA